MYEENINPITCGEPTEAEERTNASPPEYFFGGFLELNINICPGTVDE